LRDATLRPEAIVIRADGVAEVDANHRGMRLVVDVDPLEPYRVTEAMQLLDFA
jgi:hypothetical protein